MTTSSDVNGLKAEVYGLYKMRLVIVKSKRQLRLWFM